MRNEICRDIFNLVSINGLLCCQSRYIYWGKTKWGMRTWNRFIECNVIVTVMNWSKITNRHMYNNSQRQSFSFGEFQSRTSFSNSFRSDFSPQWSKLMHYLTRNLSSRNSNIFFSRLERLLKSSLFFFIENDIVLTSFCQGLYFDCKSA